MPTAKPTRRSRPLQCEHPEQLFFVTTRTLRVHEIPRSKASLGLLARWSRSKNGGTFPHVVRNNDDHLFPGDDVPDPPTRCMETPPAPGKLLPRRGSPRMPFGPVDIVDLELSEGWTPIVPVVPVGPLPSLPLPPPVQIPIPAW